MGIENLMGLAKFVGLSDSVVFTVLGSRMTVEKHGHTKRNSIICVLEDLGGPYACFR